jgi:hypothetical protein
MSRDVHEHNALIARANPEEHLAIYVEIQKSVFASFLARHAKG